MNRQTIPASSIQSIDWYNDTIIDWAYNGNIYHGDGSSKQLYQHHFAYGFDSAISSNDGKYAFIYKRLGTKGLLLKKGKVIREINRTYYHADVYEYPAAFFTNEQGITFLIHCPIDYCRLDFENVETGEIITNTSARKPSDYFHSRLEVSSDNKYFISKGWFWHPFSTIELFDINACISNPLLLDNGTTIRENYTELCTASFIDNDRILIGSSDEESMNDDIVSAIPQNHVAIWDFKTNNLSTPVKINGKFGNVFAIDETYCWDIYLYPKIINIKTGEIEDKIEKLTTSNQNSSIIPDLIDNIPLVAYNPMTKKLAFKHKNNLEILWR